MFNDIDPKIREYGTFSLIIAFIVSLIINFTLVETLRGGFGYGFPINLTDTVGLGNFLARIINSIVMAVFLSVPIYYLIMKYLLRR